MKTKTCLSVLIVIILFQFSYSQSVYLPATHWIYPLLDRLETKNIIDRIQKNNLPYTRDFIAGILSEIDLDKHQSALSAVELDLLARARGEMAEELEELNLTGSCKDLKEPHLYSWKNADHLVHFDLLVGSEYAVQNTKDETKTIQQSYYGGILRGRVYGLGFYSDNQIHSEWGRGPYNQHYSPEQGYPQSISEDSSRIIWDQSVSYLRLDIKSIQFEFGRNHVKWGPSSFGGLMLSDQLPAMDLFRMHIPVGRAHFTSLHGKLASQFKQKYISAHRVDLSVNPHLNIGIAESVIYGNRGLEWAYLNPVLPYLVAEHTLGDKDNLAIGMDFDWRFKPGGKLYGEFFIDDLFAPWEILSDYWGNRLAFTLGGILIDLFGIDNTTFMLEYTRIEPYVYTHKDSVNTYQHYNYSLGKQLHPNSDQWIFSVEKMLHRNVIARLRYTRNRHGEGDRNRPHLESDGETKKFLHGTVETQSELYLQLQIQPWRDLFVQCFYKPVRMKHVALIRDKNQEVWTAGIAVHVNW